MAAFLANVGVNAAHRVRSPLFPDGSFVVYPIPEAQPWAPPMRRLPEVWDDRAVHIDPDLDGNPPTYGDNCRTAGRARGTPSYSWLVCTPPAGRRPASSWLALCSSLRSNRTSGMTLDQGGGRATRTSVARGRAA